MSLNFNNRYVFQYIIFHVLHPFARLLDEIVLSNRWLQEIKFEPNVMCEHIDKKATFKASQVRLSSHLLGSMMITIII